MSTVGKLALGRLMIVVWAKPLEGTQLFQGQLEGTQLFEGNGKGTQLLSEAGGHCSLGGS